MKAENQEPRAENRELRTKSRPWLAIALALLLVLGSWFLVPFPTLAQAQPPDLPSYTGWVREAFAAAQRGDQPGLVDAARRLTAIASVRLDGDAVVTVDNGWLRAALAEKQPDLPAIAARLGAILDALEQPASAAPPDARARLAQLLDKPPFKRDRTNEAPGWLRALLDWLGRILELMLRSIGRAGGAAGTPLAWLIGIVGLALLLGVLGYTARGLRRGLIDDARVDHAAEAHLTAKTASEQAGELARGGDYRTAVRYMYLSALLWLDERNVLSYDRALTNREYLDRVRENPALRARMAPIVDTFDRVWYGHLPIDAASFAAYQEQIEALRSQSFEF